MSKLLTTQYTPTLIECSSSEMFSVFERKVEQVGASGLVDYIGFSIALLDDRMERLKLAKAEIDELLKAETGQQELIKIEFAKYLSENGIEKLDGDVISSIKVVEKAPTKKLVIDDEEAIIQGGYVKMVIDEKAIKDALISFGEVDGAHFETTHHEDRVTIYKRKQKDTK